MIKYHAAVLELCAAINAYPYDVPDFMPDVICTLAEHVNAPQPVAVSITYNNLFVLVMSLLLLSNSVD